MQDLIRQKNFPDVRTHLSHSTMLNSRLHSAFQSLTTADLGFDFTWALKVWLELQPGCRVNNWIQLYCFADLPSMMTVKENWTIILSQIVPLAPHPLNHICQANCNNCTVLCSVFINEHYCWLYWPLHIGFEPLVLPWLVPPGPTPPPPHLLSKL